MCTAAVFSNTKGIFNAYYTVALAPAVAAVAGAGAVALWRLGRDNRYFCFDLPVALIGSAIWAAVLLGRNQGYEPGLADAILVAGIVASIGLLCVLIGRPTSAASSWLEGGAAVPGGLALLAGPLAYSVTSIQQGSSGPLALAGPAVAGGLSPIPGMTISVASMRQASKAASHPPCRLVRYLETHRAGAQ